MLPPAHLRPPMLVQYPVRNYKCEEDLDFPEPVSAYLSKQNKKLFLPGRLVRQKDQKNLKIVDSLPSFFPDAVPQIIPGLIGLSLFLLGLWVDKLNFQLTVYRCLNHTYKFSITTIWASVPATLPIISR